MGSKLVLVGRDEKALDETIESCNPESKSEVFQENCLYFFDLVIIESSKIIKVSGDLTDPDTCKRVVEEAIKAFGKISVLVSHFKAKKE